VIRPVEITDFLGGGSASSALSARCAAAAVEKRPKLICTVTAPRAGDDGQDDGDVKEERIREGARAKKIIKLNKKIKL